MKSFQHLSRYSLNTLVLSFTFAQVELKDEDYNKTWMYMPNGDGEMKVAYLVEPPAEHDRSEVSEFIQLEYYGRYCS